MAAIDVGLKPAIDRNSAVNLKLGGTYRTWINYNNAANDTGTLTSGGVWCLSAGAGSSLKIGTFSDDGGGDFTCNDGELIGEVAAGSEVTFSGLDLDVNAGEFIGGDARSATTLRIENSTSGFAGVWYATGTLCDPTDTATFTEQAGDGMSLFADGATVGGVEHEKEFSDTIAITESIVKAVDLIKAESAIAVADAIVKAIGLVKINSFTYKDKMTMAIGLVEADSIIIVDVPVKAIQIIQADTITIADAISKEFGIPLGDAIAIADLFTYVYTPGLGLALTLALSDTITITDAFSRQVDYRLNPDDAITIIDNLERQVNYIRSLADAITIVDNMYIQWPLPARMAVARLIASRLASARLTASRIGRRRILP